MITCSHCNKYFDGSIREISDKSRGLNVGCSVKCKKELGKAYNRERYKKKSEEFKRNHCEAQRRCKQVKKEKELAEIQKLKDQFAESLIFHRAIFIKRDFFEVA